VTNHQKPAEAVSEGDPGAPVDGRRAWRDRNRLAVIDALLDLYAEGNLRPDAQEVAERSGVSRRSVFRYFDDRDDLDRAAIRRQQQRVWHLVEVASVGEGPLAERIERIAGQRVRLFSEVGPAARVSRSRAPFHRVISEELQESRRLFALQVERHFAPELNAMDEPARAETLAAADALCSFETFDLLTTRGMDSGAVAAVIRRGLSALFARAPG
jgi:AcrR family transcriptional regulator